jgi:hypothetical protein
VKLKISSANISHDPRPLEIINVDTREGIATATIYDVMQYPAIMVLQTDGQVQKIWQGNDLPLLDEVLSYARG